MLALGFLPRGPLTILKESCCGEKDLPVSFVKNATEYLRELHDKLNIAQHMLHLIRSVNKIVMRHTIIYVVVTSILMSTNKC